MNFSRDDFDRNATALLSAFVLSKKECNSGSPLNRGLFALCDWKLNHDTDGYNSWYLSHPPISVFSGNSSISNELDGDFEDEKIVVDDQCFMEATATNSKGGSQQQFVTQWIFSIVYSTTYQTPVLYYYVQETNGSPVGRQRLLKILRQERQRSDFEFSNDFPTDAWEFVSQEHMGKIRSKH